MVLDGFELGPEVDLPLLALTYQQCGTRAEHGGTLGVQEPVYCIPCVCVCGGCFCSRARDAGADRSPHLCRAPGVCSEVALRVWLKGCFLFLMVPVPTFGFPSFATTTRLLRNEPTRRVFGRRSMSKFAPGTPLSRANL